MRTYSAYWRLEHESRRLAVFFAVLLLHAVLGIMLARSSRLLTNVRIAPEAPFFIDFPRRAKPARTAVAASGIPGGDRSSREARRNSSKHSPGNVSAQSTPENQEPTPVLPPIDWTEEAAWAVRSRMQASEREKLYRNLSGLSAAQLDWVRKNHMEPADTNPPWAENRPRNNSDGVLWLSENCALVNGLPFCRIRLGRKPPRGDLFKNMRRYLDERETDPLP